MSLAYVIERAYRTIEALPECANRAALAEAWDDGFGCIAKEEIFYVSELLGKRFERAEALLKTNRPDQRSWAEASLRSMTDDEVDALIRELREIFAALEHARAATR